jgi:hypothetical protein
MARLRANLIYLSILFCVGYIVFGAFFDKAIATGNYLDAVVTRIEPIHQTSSGRSGGTISRKFDIYISIENGRKLVKRLGPSLKNQVGQKIRVQEYKSKIRGITKYEMEY